jgi:chorismate mutase
MNHSSHQVQIKAIDQALLALFEERARLRRNTSQPAAAAVEDMLRRTSGALSAEVIRELFALLDQDGGQSSSQCSGQSNSQDAEPQS